MSKIDWSKAPDGAEYWSDGLTKWLKVESGVLCYWNPIYKKWEKSHYSLQTHPDKLLKRPDFQPLTSVEDAQPEGHKLDARKVIMGAIPPDAELAVARVLTFGAEKYARDNWRKVTDMDVRYMDAALRHLNAHRRGEQIDSESGESHLAHAACCIMFLLQIEEESK